MASKKVIPSVPGKKAEAKTSIPSKPAKAFRSAEFIEDSDEEATKVARKKHTPKAVPHSTKLTRPKADTSITKPSKKRKSPSPSPEKEESTQSDNEEERSSHSGDSSENEESSSAQEGSPTPARPKETASRPATNSAAVEDSVGKSQMNKPKAPGKSSLRRTPSPRTASPSENEEDSESSAGGDESGSESESSDQTSRKGPRKESPIEKPVTCTQENSSISFEPPSGFEPASIVVHPSSQAMDMFSPTKLAGKEIWHLTAPSSVIISSIKEVSQQSILSRSSILSYEGSNYGLIPDSSTDQALLLPSAEDNDYKSHNAATIQSFHLQQIVSLPYHALSPAKSSNQTAPTPQAYKRAPREQPEGLKMRYHPFGVVDISDDDLSSKDVPKIPHFRVPGAVDATPAEKRKRFSIDHGAQSPTISSSKVKSKKAKVRQEATVNQHDDVMDVDTVEQPASQKQDASKTKANGVLENHTPKSAKSKKTKPKATDEKPDHPPHQSAASQSLLPADIAEQAEIIMPEEVITNGASAIEITASEEKKTKRKRRKEAAETENVAKADVDVEMRDAESPSRELEGQSATPGKGSAQKKASATNGEMDEIQATPQETKEERRKRKEEKRKRKREAAKV